VQPYMNTLQFKDAVRLGGSDKHERHYFDFIVSGQSLRDILNVSKSDLISPFGWFENKAEEKLAKQELTLRQKTSLDTGRIMLYVCPECGDIACGAITAIIVDLGDRIVWKDFGYETGNGGISELYSHIQPIEFSRQEYFNAFSQLP